MEQVGVHDTVDALGDVWDCFTGLCLPGTEGQNTGKIADARLAKAETALLAAFDGVRRQLVHNHLKLCAWIAPVEVPRGLQVRASGNAVTEPANQEALHLLELRLALEAVGLGLAGLVKTFDQVPLEAIRPIRRVPSAQVDQAVDGLVP